MCLSVCPSQVIPRKAVEVIIINLSMVTASDMRVHHELIILTMTFIQDHTDHNHENNQGLIISKEFQAMPITFSVKIVRLKVYIISSHSDDLALHSVTTVSQI